MSRAPLEKQILSALPNHSSDAHRCAGFASLHSVTWQGLTSAQASHFPFWSFLDVTASTSQWCGRVNTLTNGGRVPVDISPRASPHQKALWD